MNLSLSDEQWREIRKGAPPLSLVDPETGVSYLLMREEVMKQFQSLFADGPLSNEERATILRGVWERANWNDPAMDEYESLDPRKKA